MAILGSAKGSTDDLRLSGMGIPALAHMAAALALAISNNWFLSVYTQLIKSFTCWCNNWVYIFTYIDSNTYLQAYYEQGAQTHMTRQLNAKNKTTARWLYASARRTKQTVKVWRVKKIGWVGLDCNKRTRISEWFRFIWPSSLMRLGLLLGLLCFRFAALFLRRMSTGEWLGSRFQRSLWLYVALPRLRDTDCERDLRDLRRLDLHRRHYNGLVMKMDN